jgi:hypothetical protein
MRTTILTAALLMALALPAMAGDGTYGAALTQNETTAITAILEDPDAFKGSTVMIEGTVTEMCAHKGCWLVLDDGEGHTLLAKSTGDKVAVSEDATGRKVMVEGVVVVEYKAAKPDKHDHEEGEEGHDCRTAKIRLETLGVVVPRG